MYENLAIIDDMVHYCWK